MLHLERVRIVYEGHAAGDLLDPVNSEGRMGATAIHAERANPADHRLDHGRMLAHAEIIVRIPNWFSDYRGRLGYSGP